MFDYPTMNRRDREAKEDQGRRDRSHVATVNVDYRNKRHALAEKHKKEVVDMQHRHENEHRLQLIKQGAPLGTPPHQSESRRMRLEGKELADKHAAERGDLAERYEHDLSRARATDAKAMEVRR
jgi:hypothetical protein